MPTRNYQQPYNPQQQPHHRSQHLHKSPSSSHHQNRHRHDTDDVGYDVIDHHDVTPVRRSKNRHRKHGKSQEHLIDPEEAAELLQKCLLTLGDSSGIVLQKLTQKQQQVQQQQQQQQQPQEQNDMQKLRRCLHNKVSSSTATSPC